MAEFGDDGACSLHQVVGRIILLALAAMVALIFATGVLVGMAAFGGGDHPDASPEIREWFRSVTSPAGIPCCDIADGHRTVAHRTDDHFYVVVEGEVVQVPNDTVVKNAGNPFGEAVVWYYRRDGQVVIRCFVPAAEV